MWQKVTIKVALSVLSILYGYFSYLMVDEELHSAWSSLMRRCTTSRPADYLCISKKQGTELGGKSDDISNDSHHSIESEYHNGNSVNSISDQKMLLTAPDGSNLQRSDYVIEMSLFNGRRHGDVQ